jgi:hypothetical protein
MADEYADPSGNTEAFRAFAQTPEQTAGLPKLPLIIGGVLTVVLLAAVLGWLALG